MNPITRINLYQTFKNDKPYLYSKDGLQKQLEKYNNEAASLGVEIVSLEDFVAKAFPDGGEWVFIDLKTDFTMADDMIVKKKCFVNEDGREKHDPSRFEGSLVEVAVVEWNLFYWEYIGDEKIRRVYQMNGEGLKRMRPQYYQDVIALIQVHCYDGAENPDLLDFLSRKPDGSLRQGA